MADAAPERRASRQRRPAQPSAARGDARNVTILVLGAGAPHSPLMAGALHALLKGMERDGKRPFDYYYTSGGGALIGLLALAPASGDKYKALEDIVEFGVSDSIYRLLPLGYKTFYKPGPFMPQFQAMAQRVKQMAPPTAVTLVSTWLELLGGPSGGWTWSGSPRAGEDRARRVFNDWVDLIFTALAPAPVSLRSTGLCRPAPFLETLVDFDAIRRHDNFVVNAFNLSRGVMEQFHSSILTADHVRASIAYPFIYPPVEIDGHFYSEGADHDPINLRDLPKVIGDAGHPGGTIVLIDILSSLGQYLLRPPRDLWDAYGMSIMTPVVSLARKDIELFLGSEAAQRYKLLPTMTFEIPEYAQPYMLDWSYSNMCTMWDVGHAAGEDFYQRFGNELP